MSLFSRLFGGKNAQQDAKASEEYKGFSIHPDPIKEGPRWRLAARIEKVVGGETKTHDLIRADVLEGEEAAIAASVGKAKQVIDEQGDRLFD